MSGYGGADVQLDPSLHTFEGAPAETNLRPARKTVTDRDVRCQGQVPVRHEPGEFKVCNRLLAKLVGRPWELQCPRCKQVNVSPKNYED